jgi:DNA polymerase V
MFDFVTLFKHYLRMNEKKAAIPSKRGGKRKGAGRKKQYEDAKVTVRIPESIKETVLTMREYTKHHIDFSVIPVDAMMAAEALSSQPIPLYSSAVAAGFPSPADDHVDKRLDLNEHFIHSPASTFFLRATGDSMNQAGIIDNTILQVDKSLPVQQHDIVVATVDGEFTVKRYRKDGQGRVGLYPDSSNPIHQPIFCTKGRDISIWGVVSAIHHKLR